MKSKVKFTIPVILIMLLVAANCVAVEISVSYSYDKLNRLTSASYNESNNQATLSYGYDELGNITAYSVYALMDTDGDGLFDDFEITNCTDVYDADSDDDGLLDGDEDQNQNGIVELYLGETDPCDADTDNDGVQDGTELGVVDPIIDPDGSGPLLGTNLDVFQPDLDPTTQTDPTLKDTDGDRIPDGLEDLNKNGAIDGCEIDPLSRTTEIIADMDNDGDVDGVDLALAAMDFDVGFEDECLTSLSVYFGHDIFPADPDYDGILSDGDYSSLAGDNLCSDGETTDCDDNCQEIYNPDQSDSNGNGIGDVCDLCKYTVTIVKPLEFPNAFSTPPSNTIAAFNDSDTIGAPYQPGALIPETKGRYIENAQAYAWYNIDYCSFSSPTIEIRYFAYNTETGSISQSFSLGQEMSVSGYIGEIKEWFYPTSMPINYQLGPNEILGFYTTFHHFGTSSRYYEYIYYYDGVNTPTHIDVWYDSDNVVSYFVSDSCLE